MLHLRSIAFSIVFYGLSVPLVLGAPIAALFGTMALRRYAMRWVGFLRWCARVFLGITARIDGELPTGPVLFVAKHESNLEPMLLSRMLGSPATVMKRELMNIPIWGWTAKRYGVIVVDRDTNAAALRGMMREAQSAIAEGRSVLIFPEGTRVPVGESPALRSGFAGLYRILGLPVVPIALRTGHVWPKKGPFRPGVVSFTFGEAIPPGLPRAEAEARVHAAINRLNTPMSAR